MAFKPNVRIRIVDFYTKAREKTEGKLFLGPDGKPIYDDWVAYSPIGSKEEVRAPIARLANVNDANPNNPSHAVAVARWAYIEPAYKAWKRGEEAPEVGTPLGAANFLRKEDVQALKRNGIRSVEEFVSMPEGARDRAQIPRIRDLQKQAKAFLEAQDQNKAVAALAERDEKINALESRLKALEAQLTTPAPPPIMAPLEGNDPLPPKPLPESMQVLAEIRRKKAEK